MAPISFRSAFRNIATASALAGLTATAALPSDLCPDLTDAPLFNPDNHALCESLWPEVQSPSNAGGTPKPLNDYEAKVGQFFNHYCHRDPDLKDTSGRGWANDKYVRDTGPYVAFRNEQNEWVTQAHGFHAPVVIWYSPQMVAWLETNRPADGPAVENPEPIPDGVIIAKEMYTPPGSRCRGDAIGETQAERDAHIAKLAPQSGIAYMIRDLEASQDGWFWGYFGFFEADASKPYDGDPNVDWPPRKGNGAPYAGFGQYCLNCHASAADNSTFSTLANVAGYPGDPLTFLSMDWVLTEVESDIPEHVPQLSAMMAPIPNSTPLKTVPSGFSAIYNIQPGDTPSTVEQITLPSQTYDNVWAEAGETPPLSSEYLTSDQCAGCHDAGSTGLAFDMTQPNPHGDNLINLSPYATWRSSPMGLAGRDPIFFAQMSSEETFHEEYEPLIWNTCFGCHGIMGQRQFQLDQTDGDPDATCNVLEPVFNPDFVTAVPWSGQEDTGNGGPHYDPEHAKYGALARDGISCIACHRAGVTEELLTSLEGQPQNHCVEGRQDVLNGVVGDLSGFGKTFTGSYPVADPSTVFGPFGKAGEEPIRTLPMLHALGNLPQYNSGIASSEQCGTCHTVHLPVLWPMEEPGKLNIIADTFEQTTYPEWLFSRFRTGTAAFLPEGKMLPSGAGETPVSCAGCHMESHASDGTPFESRIASIQQKTNMPEAENTALAEEIDIPTRKGFARHTLVGLNLFLVKMAQQFPDILGIPLEDPMLVAKGMAGLQRTENEMVANAEYRSATIGVEAQRVTDTSLEVAVRINNLAGHKFPSGVSFRRAFVEFEVMGTDGATIWHSGRTDEYGVLLGTDGKPLIGELWYDNMCNKIVDQTDFQPHYQTISHQDQVQIYQEIKLNPGDPAKVEGNPSCEPGVEIEPSANLTTSFLSICHTPKDNRLLPPGQLSFDERVAIAVALGLPDTPNRFGGESEAHKLAMETGAFGVGDDPDYVTGGGDTVVYRIPLSDMVPGQFPASVRATLHYQATPPFFLQDRFCTATGANRDRLFHISSLLDTKGTPIEDWKFKMVSTGVVPVGD
ncbi:MAG: hypothetical protein QNJ44_04100 [Rhodobacter sp.]|nr:hypothetical protein [Rhodobacter sp.]